MPSSSSSSSPSNKNLAYIALGSNLGDSRGTILQAMDRLQVLSLAPILRSSLWESTPVDCPTGSSKFINAVIALLPRAGETPESLLEQLQNWEREFGRQPKTIHNEPRPLDLDLIAFGREVRATSELTLPHPRTQFRRFVLQPLSEIAPDLILPGQSETIGHLLAVLTSAESLRRIE